MENEETPLLKREFARSPGQGQLRTWKTSLKSLWLVWFLSFWVVLYSLLAIITAKTESSIHDVQQCTIRNLHKNTSFLDRAKPITSNEFIQRRDNLAKAIHASGADGFVLEPGYTFQYYGNISQKDWEPWEPEERPFLMIVQPVETTDGDIVAKTSFLAPHFEEGRVRMLGIPAQEKELDITVWEEHWNPYETLRDGLFPGKNNSVLMVDEEMRDYIVRGLSSAGFGTIGLSKDVEAVRQTKSPAEVELLRAVNTGTVAAIRAMRRCTSFSRMDHLLLWTNDPSSGLRPGLTEDQVTTILDRALLSLGFSTFFDIVLFEGNAALPHGGFETGNKVLT